MRKHGTKWILFSDEGFPESYLGIANEVYVERGRL